MFFFFFFPFRPSPPMFSPFLRGAPVNKNQCAALVKRVQDIFLFSSNLPFLFYIHFLSALSVVFEA